MPAGACTRATGTLDSVFCRAEEGTLRWDLATDSLQHISPMRPACHDGVVISEGKLYWGPWICGCHLTLVGIIAVGPAGDFDFNQRADESKQLEKLGEPTSAQPLIVAANDWPTYEANSQRTRMVNVAAPRTCTTLWEQKTSDGNTPTAPVAAGNLALLAGTDGIIRAFDAQTGQPQWKAATGSSIYFPPSLAEGRALAGSNDGHVYAYEAMTGAPLWRFRVAPADRRIPVYGQLMSTWPVAGGVLADGGTVYAAAGISHFDGTHVVALDAATGRLKWHNNSSGIVDPKVRNGISVCGALRLENGQLRFPGGNVYVDASYDIATGKCLNTPAGPRTSRRIFLFPRKLWEPIYNAQQDTPAGRVTVRAAPGLSLTFQPTTPQARAWSMKLATFAGCASTKDALLVLARLSEQEQGQVAPYRLLAINLLTGQTIFSQPLPATPVQWGLAIDARARVYVSMEDGRLTCFADEP